MKNPLLHVNSLSSHSHIVMKDVTVISAQNSFNKKKKGSKTCGTNWPFWIIFSVLFNIDSRTSIFCWLLRLFLNFYILPAYVGPASLSSPGQVPGSGNQPGVWLWWSVSTFWVPAQAARESGETPRLCLEPGGVYGSVTTGESWDLVPLLGGGFAGEHIRVPSIFLPSWGVPQSPVCAWLCESFDSIKGWYFRNDIHSLLPQIWVLCLPNMDIC